MNNLQDEQCALTLDNLVFDKISFVRKDFKSDDEPHFSFDIMVGKKEEEKIYRVTLVLKVEKAKEYEIEISLTGYFILNAGADISDEMAQELINKNTVAILMPYIRSELSLLTAQPGMECIVLPPFNIGSMIDNAK